MSQTAATWRERFDGLSDAELHVAGCIAEGMSNKEIARARRSTPSTIKKQIHALEKKLGVEHRIGIARAADAAGVAKPLTAKE